MSEGLTKQEQYALNWVVLCERWGVDPNTASSIEFYPVRQPYGKGSLETRRRINP